MVSTKTLLLKHYDTMTGGIDRRQGNHLPGENIKKINRPESICVIFGGGFGKIM